VKLWSAAWITDDSLHDLLQQVHDSRIQVPEFQREPVLYDDGIISLLASVSLRYPIGSFDLLATGDPDTRFDTHPVAGAPASPRAEPEWLVIDGQQRLGALYQVLASGHAVDGARWYYVDVERSLDPTVDRDEAIFSVENPDVVDNELAFPLRLVFGPDAQRDRWLRAASPELVHRFEAEVLDAFRAYRMPVIRHATETTRWSVRVHGGPDGPTLSDRFRVSNM
jgi:hypothetical protein